MPKQILLSKDFFINASEAEARQYVLELPNCISNIKFVEENQVRHSLRFIYQGAAETAKEHNYVEVSLLPLNVDQTRVTLQSSYVNGTMSQKEFQISNALCNFESAIHAVVEGTIEEYVPQKIKMDQSRNLNIVLTVAGLAGIIYLIRNFLT